MGGGVAHQPRDVSAVVCRCRSLAAAVSVLWAARLLSLRGPVRPALSLDPIKIRAAVDFKSGPTGVEREQGFQEALRTAAAELSELSPAGSCLTLNEEGRHWSPEQANAVISALLQRGAA